MKDFLFTPIAIKPITIFVFLIVDFIVTIWSDSKNETD